LERTDLIKHIFLVFAGAIVFLWTLYLMITPLRFALGLTLCIITFVVGELLLSGNRDMQNNRSHVKFFRFPQQISAELVILVAFVSSLIITLLVPAVEGEIFVEWASLELPIVARLIAAFGLNFFPGYFILAIVGAAELGKLARLITSYLLSLSLLSITGFMCAYVRGIVDELLFKVFFSLCIAIIAVYLFSRFLQWKRAHRLENPGMSVPPSSVSKNILPVLLVFLAVIFMCIWLWQMYSSIGFFIGAPGFDSWRMLGNAQAFLDYKAFAWLKDPWWFYLYLASFIRISGAPSVNAYMALYPLIILPVLVFYLMASSFFKDKRIASIATLSYAIFSGPTWLYALYLRDFGPVVSYDDWIKIVYEAGEKFLVQGWYPPFMVSFTHQTLAYAFLWFMVYASWRLDLSRKFNFFVLSITVALSYLIHGIDSIIFAIYLFAFLLLCLFTQNVEGKKRVRLSAMSILVAIVVVGLIDLSLTSQYDYFNSIYGSWARTTVPGFAPRFALRWYYFNSPSFYLLAFSSVLIIALTYSNFVDKKLGQLCQVICKRFTPTSVKKGLAELIMWLYGVSLIVFVVLFPYINWAATSLGQVPWYVYPVVGGVPFFLGVVGIAIVLFKWNEVEVKIRNAIVFCALSLVLLFILGQVVSFANEKFFYTGFWESRVLAYVGPIMSLLMAYALVASFNRVRVKAPLGMKHIARVGTVSLFISLIVFSSVSTTLISGDFAQRVFFAMSLTKEELEALRYLHYSLPPGSKTAYLARNTGSDYINGFANDKWTPDQYQWLGQFYHSPSSVISAIRQADIKFLYLNHVRDLEDLKKNLFIQQLIKVLPVEFNNSEVTIYSIPPLQYPSPMAPLRLVSLEEEVGAMYDAYVLWSMSLMMSEYSYGIISNVTDTVNLDGAQSIILPYDPPIEKDVEQLLEWVSNGGHLILSGTNPYGVFSKSVGLMSKVSLANCDSTENWSIFYRPELDEILIENAVKIEGSASLRLRNNQSDWEEWIYTPPAPWNLTGYEYVGIWVYGTGVGPKWLLYLVDSKGLNRNENYFEYDLNFTGWKLHLIPIKQYYGSLDLSAIKELRIITGKDLPVNILIDDIFVLEESERSIVRANGIQGTINIDLPIIEVEDLSPSADAMVIANYTLDGVPVAPFAIQKNLGSGSVTYLNANLLYQSILSGGSGFTSPYEVLVKILETTGVEKPP
jgi:hypothetical protein